MNQIQTNDINHTVSGEAHSRARAPHHAPENEQALKKSRSSV